MTDFIELIDERLTERDAKKDKEDFDREIRGIVQEVILSGLAETDFFKNNVFLGGTSIRILHGLDRYSDDLDFNSVIKDEKFTWDYYFRHLDKHIEKYGLKFEYDDHSDEDFNLKRSYIKDRSILDMLHNKGIVAPRWTKISGGEGKKARVKMETSSQVSTFGWETRKLFFPSEYSVKVMDINSLFAGKLNACLTRSKKAEGKNERERADVGRDWYDLAWYVQKGVRPNYGFLSDKLNDKGPYQGQGIKADLEWVKENLLSRIDGLNYKVLNEELHPLTRKENRIVLSREFLMEAINNIEKEGYRIEYDKVEKEGRKTGTVKNAKR